MLGEIKPIQWVNGRLVLLDQTRLPLEQISLELDHYQQAVDAIREMRVRGAPAIGITAAYAMAMAARDLEVKDPSQFLVQLGEAAAVITSARPTAVNLQWAVQRMLQVAESESNLTSVKSESASAT